jgi:hypothetical protein
MDAIRKQLTANYIAVQDLQTKSRILADQLIAENGSILDDNTFWDMTQQLRSEINNSHSRNRRTSAGIHNFFCDFYEDIPKLVNFIYTYDKKVSTVAKNDQLLKNANNHGLFSPNGWNDFTDFLPLHGKEAYEHVINDRRTHEVYKCEREEYIRSNLIEKFMLFATTE